MKTNFLITLLVTASLLMTSCSNATKNLEFDYDTDGYAYVAGVKDGASIKVLKIPNTIKRKEDGKKYQVKGTSEFAFSGNQELEEVIFPESVSIIDEGSFSDCTNLKKVVFTESISIIEREAFNGCTGLQEVVGLTNRDAISHEAFVGCLNIKNKKDILPLERIVNFLVEGFEPGHTSSSATCSDYYCNMGDGSIYIKGGHDIITCKIEVPEGEQWIYKDHDSEYMCGERKGWFGSPYIIVNIRGKEKKYKLPDDGRDFVLYSGDTFQIGTYFAHGFFQYANISVVFAVKYDE